MDGRLIFTATDRVDYFTQVAEAWSAVPAVEAWRPQVFCEPTDVLDDMLGVALSIPGAAAIINPIRYGVLHNPWQALEATFADGAHFVVLAEDDVLVSTDVLDLMSYAARALRDEHILAVRACSFFEHCPPGDEHVLVTDTAFCPLVWGTWADRWYGTLRESWDHDYTTGTPEAPQSGWDWNLNLRVIPAGGWRIAQPVASRATHIGRRGTHTTLTSFPGSVAATFTAYREPAPAHQWSIR